MASASRKKAAAPAEKKGRKFSTQDERNAVIREIGAIQSRAVGLSIPKRILNGSYQEVVAYKTHLGLLEQDPFFNRLPRPRTTIGRLNEIRDRLQGYVRKVA